MDSYASHYKVLMGEINEIRSNKNEIQQDLPYLRTGRGNIAKM